MKSLSALKELRDAQGLSQRDLARLSSVAQVTVSQLERGERKARPSTLRKLANALGVTPDDLLAAAKEEREAAAMLTSADMSPEYQRWVAAGDDILITEGYSEPSHQSYSVINQDRGVERQFSSALEAYVAGYNPEYEVSHQLPSLPPSIKETVKDLQARAVSDDTEEVEEAAETALLMSRNHLNRLESAADATARWEEAIRDHPYKYPGSVYRIAKLGPSVAKAQAAYQRDVARVVRQLLEVREEAMHKLQVMHETHDAAPPHELRPYRERGGGEE
jgi:transcriptional regulator with XRE-family HTH domain